MKRTLWPIPLLALLALLTAGCYTKFYRPGMETAGRGPYDTLYDRDDSTAIDTTLTREDYPAYEYPPDRWDRWSYWGRPRTYTRWGFDFYNFSPDYYWSYYGYYDYYGTPWWYDWYDWRWWHGPYGTPAPGEPPSQRPRGRRDHDGGSGLYSDPNSPAPSSPTYAQPNPPANNPSPTSKNNDDSKKQSSDDGKRDGRRGR